MRSQSITEIMGRIAVAEIDSPIAVFLNPDGTYRSQFAAPVLTSRALEMRPPNRWSGYGQQPIQSAQCPRRAWLQ
jgi:hypothetical protein